MKDIKSYCCYYTVTKDFLMLDSASAVRDFDDTTTLLNVVFYPSISELFYTEILGFYYDCCENTIFECLSEETLSILKNYLFEFDDSIKYNGVIGLLQFMSTCDLSEVLRELNSVVGDYVGIPAKFVSSLDELPEECKYSIKSVIEYRDAQYTSYCNTNSVVAYLLPCNSFASGSEKDIPKNGILFSVFDSLYELPTLEDLTYTDIIEYVKLLSRKYNCNSESLVNTLIWYIASILVTYDLIDADDTFGNVLLKVRCFIR